VVGVRERERAADLHVGLGALLARADVSFFALYLSTSLAVMVSNAVEDSTSLNRLQLGLGFGSSWSSLAKPATAAAVSVASSSEPRRRSGSVESRMWAATQVKPVTDASTGPSFMRAMPPRVSFSSVPSWTTCSLTEALVADQVELVDPGHDVVGAAVLEVELLALGQAVRAADQRDVAVPSIGAFGLCQTLYAARSVDDLVGVAATRFAVDHGLAELDRVEHLAGMACSVILSPTMSAPPKVCALTLTSAATCAGAVRRIALPSIAVRSVVASWM
jgi:hypothetical protein